MKRILPKVLLIILPLLIWYGFTLVTPAYLVPRPFEVLKLILEMWKIFTVDLFITFTESIGGLLIGLVVSFSIAIGFQLIPKLENLIMPYAIAAKSVPIVAIAPLLVLWCGNGLVGKVVLAALICFFPLLVGFSDGLKSLPRELRFLGAVWSPKQSRILWLVAFPYALPYLFSALKVAAPLAVVGAVVAEFSGANKGLGHSALVAAYHSDAAMLFAAIILISTLGIALYLGIVLIETRYLKKMRVQRVI